MATVTAVRVVTIGWRLSSATFFYLFVCLFCIVFHGRERGSTVSITCLATGSVLRLKILLQFALFTCFVDEWYLKKKKNSIDIQFRICNVLISGKCPYFANFSAKQRFYYAFQHSWTSLREKQEFTFNQEKRCLV